MNHLIAFVVGIAAMMLSVYVFAPQADNRILRAVVVSLVTRVGIVVVFLVAGITIHPVVGLVAAGVVPLVVVKLWYNVSIFRAWVIMLFVSALTFLSDHLVEKFTHPAPAPVVDTTQT